MCSLRIVCCPVTVSGAGRMGYGTVFGYLWHGCEAFVDQAFVMMGITVTRSYVFFRWAIAWGTRALLGPTGVLSEHGSVFGLVFGTRGVSAVRHLGI